MDFKIMDTSVKSNDGVWMPIRNIESGEPIIDEKTGKPVRWKVCGTNSKIFQKQQKIMADAEKRTRKGLSTAEQTEYARKIYSACVLEWECMEDGNKPLECTPENVRLVFDTSEPIFKQLVEFIDTASNFLA